MEEVVISNKLIREDVTKKVTFMQRLKEGERGSLKSKEKSEYKERP